jgi:TonB family protein
MFQQGGLTMRIRFLILWMFAMTSTANAADHCHGTVVLKNSSNKDLYLQIDGRYCSPTNAWPGNGLIQEQVTGGGHTLDAVEYCNAEKVLASVDAEVECGGIYKWQLNEDDLNSSALSDANAIKPAEAIHRPHPAYPPAALTQNIEGCVIVSFDITSLGLVQNVGVTSSDSHIFNEAAISAVSIWRYEPAKQDGVPIESHGHATELCFYFQ